MLAVYSLFLHDQIIIKETTFISIAIHRRRRRRRRQ
jgi:hypothetical protein